MNQRSGNRPINQRPSRQLKPQLKQQTKPRRNVRNKPMKLSLFKYKITVLFIVLTVMLILISMFYDKKNENYQIFIGEKPTEYITESREGLDYVKLSIVKSIGSFIHYDETEVKDIIVLPNNELLIVDYVTKTVTNQNSSEKVDVNILGDSIEDVLIALDDLKKITCFKIQEDERQKMITIENIAEFSIAEKLEKQSKYSYFDYSRIVEYFNFMIKYPDLQSYDAIMAVNIGLYRPFYSETTEIQNESEYTAIANKYYSLPSNYAPVDLIDKGDGKSLRQKAYNAFDNVKADMQKEGMNLYLISAYRSYSRQVTLYNNYVSKDGVERADEFSARPGHSEHQSGLAMDVMHTTNLINNLSGTHFENTKEYEWLIKNGYKYGLILRYPLGKESITGYMYEPWHWRYVGEDVAQFMKDNEIETLEEFHALKGATEGKFPELNELNEVATLHRQNFIVDEKTRKLLGYEIDGFVYYDVTDIADFVRETKYQFKPVYEPNTGKINLIKGIGSGISHLEENDKNVFENYIVADIEILVDNFGVKTEYDTYIINGNLYISLVDISKILGINLKWDYGTNSFSF